MRLCKHGKILYCFYKIFRKNNSTNEGKFCSFIDVLSTRSGQSCLLLANENTHLTTHEPIKICVIKVKIKLKFVASVSESLVDDGDFSFESS